MRRVALVLLLALFALPAAAQDSQSSDEGRHRGGEATSAPTTLPSDSEPASDSNDTRERITRYDSDVTIARNGTLTVVEAIGVYVTNDQIKHGIYRDFPTLYTDKRGNNVRVSIAISQRSIPTNAVTTCACASTSRR
jgi:hypothetical protein